MGVQVYDSCLKTLCYFAINNLKNIRGIYNSIKLKFANLIIIEAFGKISEKRNYAFLHIDSNSSAILKFYKFRKIQKDVTLTRLIFIAQANVWL